LLEGWHVSPEQQALLLQSPPTPGHEHLHAPDDWMQEPAPGQHWRLIGLLAPHSCEDCAQEGCDQLHAWMASKIPQPSGWLFSSLHIMVAT